MEINPLKVHSIRSYSKKEINKKIAEIEKQSLEYRNTKAEVLSKYPNPKKLTFKQSLAELTGNPVPVEAVAAPDEDDEGFILDIK